MKLMAPVLNKVSGSGYRLSGGLLDNDTAATRFIAEIQKAYFERRLDRIEGLAEIKEKTLAATEEVSVLQKLDFTWP